MAEDGIKSFWRETAQVLKREGVFAAVKKVRRAAKEEIRILFRIKCVEKESQLAKKYCKGRGLEIGGAAHNPFNLDTLNVDYTSELNEFKRMEIRKCFRHLPVDIVAPRDNIPLPDESQDFIVSSHVLEHFFDPMKTLMEWERLIKKGGVIFMIIPHRDRTFDSGRERTTLRELIDRHEGRAEERPSPNNHHSVWITEDVAELVEYMNKRGYFKTPLIIAEAQDVDDKAGNGFTVVLAKEHSRQEKRM
ncbi:MAG TPA: class I SAM-dependent methyltransferase [bacterium]|nr:class I SAM-dependent methyltransferase [bacterium]